MKYSVKVEYGHEKFAKFSVSAEITDAGVVTNYTFHNLVDDIRRRCNSLRMCALRIRYEDEDGDFVNLNEDEEDNFKEMFVRASSVEGSVGRIRLRVSELDSPAVHLSDSVKRRQCAETRQEIENKKGEASNTQQTPQRNARYAPRTLEQRYEEANTSTAKSGQSPLDYVKAELKQNMELKKVLLSSAEEELKKLVRTSDSLTPLSAIRARVCGNCHKPGHTRPKCVSLPCQSYEDCSLGDKHPELKEKITLLQKQVKKLQGEYNEAESKLRAFNEARMKTASSFFAVMRPRLKVRNLIKYSDRVQLDRDLMILQKALSGKVPDFDESEDWRLPIIIEQYPGRNVHV